MYEKLTEKAQKVFKYARQEAERMGHQYIGTEHLLLGLVREGTGVAATVLQRLGVDPERVRVEVEKIVKGGTDVISTGRKFTLAPPAKKAFEYAFEEAKRLGQNYIGTEHLLLGLLRQEQGIAAQVLLSLGVELGEVREALMELLGARGAQPKDVAISLALAQGVKDVLERAAQEAKDRGASEVEIEHLLLALVSRQRWLVQDAQRQLADLRAEIDRRLQGFGEPGGRDSERQGDKETQ
jgi:ATP-dependent Clp protease ATP-binding subunit ClpA